MTRATSEPGTSPLDRPSRRRCRSVYTATGASRASRRATPTPKRCVGVTDRGLKFGEPEDKQAARPAITGAESWAVSERTESIKTRYLSDPDPAVAKILAGVGTRAAVCVFCGSATLPHGLESHAEACEGGGAAPKTRGPLMRGGPARSSRRGGPSRRTCWTLLDRKRTGRL